MRFLVRKYRFWYLCKYEVFPLQSSPVFKIFLEKQTTATCFESCLLKVLLKLYKLHFKLSKYLCLNTFVTNRTTYMSHLKRVFQVRWDNSIPLFLHAAIYLEVSLFRWTSQNAFSRETTAYKWYCVQCCIAALHTVSFLLGCFAGKCILTCSTE